MSDWYVGRHRPNDSAIVYITSASNVGLYTSQLVAGKLHETTGYVHDVETDYVGQHRMQETVNLSDVIW